MLCYSNPQKGHFFWIFVKKKMIENYEILNKKYELRNIFFLSFNLFYLGEKYFSPINGPYVSFLIIGCNRFREYGLWARYADLYPRNDLVYTIGVSNYERDWFYAHVTR